MMRIAIDMQGAQTGSRHRGIGRYTIALARAMVRRRGEHEVILLLNGMFPETLGPIREAFSDLLPRTQIRVWNALAPVYTDDERNTPRRKIAEAIREDFIRRINPDIVHITSFFEGFGDNAVHKIKGCGQGGVSPRVAVTFYDLIPLIQKEIYLDPNPHFQKPYYEKVEQLKNADLLLSISESSRSEAVKYLNYPPERVINISSAVDEGFHPMHLSEEDVRRIKDRLGIRDRFIMYSGATDDRKNHVGLITAYSMLPKEIRTSYQLVLVGGMPLLHKQHFEQHIKKCKLDNEEVVITGRVSDSDLIDAYRVCDLYVFPSWHEGFGLPALEAMACGAPVIGANTTSVPEVIGLERALFDPHSPRDIAKKIYEVLSDPRFLVDLKAHSLQQAKKFSWDESASRAIRAFETLEAPRSSDEECLRAQAQRTLMDQLAPIIASDDIDLVRLAKAMALNSSENRRQLLVDVSELVQRDSRTGIQRVVRSILMAWLARAPQGFSMRLVYASSDVLGYRYADRFTKNFIGQCKDLDGPSSHGEDCYIDFGDGDVFVALDMQHEIQIFQAPFYQKMRDYGVDVRFVIYDLLPITMPQYFSRDASANHSLWIETAAKAEGIVCISHSVACEFEGWLNVQPKYAHKRPVVQWFHLGADIQSSKPTTGVPMNAESLLESIRASTSFLMVGTVEPRKGYEQVLDALNRIWKKGGDVKLTIVGKRGWRVEEFVARLRSHVEIGRRLFWLEGISDEYLEKIYSASACLIAGSYGEGFGLPLIEAAQHKLPIIARDIPVFREVAGECAFFFKAENSEQLAGAIEAWIDLHSKQLHPRSDGIRWQTWAESADQLNDILTGSTRAIAVPGHSG